LSLFSLSIAANPVPVAGGYNGSRSLLIVRNGATRRFSGMGFASTGLILEYARRLEPTVGCCAIDEASNTNRFLESHNTSANCDRSLSRRMAIQRHPANFVAKLRQSRQAVTVFTNSVQFLQKSCEEYRYGSY
jgi:hypothetical protein